MKINLKRLFMGPASNALILAAGLMTAQRSADAQAIYIGDDAAEGAAVTAGGVVGDSVVTLTYDFVQNNGSIYTNSSAIPETAVLNSVNFYAGPNSGIL